MYRINGLQSKLKAVKFSCVDFFLDMLQWLQEDRYTLMSLEQYFQIQQRNFNNGVGTKLIVCSSLFKLIYGMMHCMIFFTIWYKLLDEIVLSRQDSKLHSFEHHL